MLNQKHNVHKRTNSKILLIILCIFGLLFSWSCSCKNRVSDPNETPIDGGIKDNETPPPPGTFSMSASTDNVVASTVKASGTVGDIKISFVSANDYAYTMDYTVDDATETVEENKIDKTNFTVANNVLTAHESLLTKVRALDSSTSTKEKTITINFTFKANDATLKNNTQNLSVDVTLTKSWQPANTDDSYIGTIFNGSGRIFAWLENNEYDTILQFPTSAGDYQNKVYTLKSDKNGYTKDIPKSEVKSKFIDLINRQTQVTKYFTVSDSGEEAKIEQTTAAADTVSFTVNLAYTDILEGTTDKITVKFVIASGNDTVKFVEQ